MLDDILSNPWAYLPPRSSLWLWVAGPLMMIAIYALVMRSSGAERKKRLREADIWRASLADPGAKKDGPKGKQSNGPPRVASVPSGLRGALVDVGGGDQVVHYELVSDLAYLSFMEANATAGSDYQTISAKLEVAGPAMVVRPLPIIDGARSQNTGVQFKKDPELMEKFLVEGEDAKAIGKWLSAPIRRALCEVPWAWLRVQGKTMTVTGFGTLEAAKLDALVELADAVFAEHGAEGGPSLFGDEPANDDPMIDVKLRAVPATATTLADTPSAKSKKKS
jgi:hypothetical protein